MAKKTSWLIGGPAEKYAEPATLLELQTLQALGLKQHWQIRILGGGTNILVPSAGVSGLVISLSGLRGLDVFSVGNTLKFWALAGTPKSHLLKIFLKHKLLPAAFLAGLPGQVGGGVVMNAGISENLVPKEFQEITEKVEVLRPDGTFEILNASNLKWSYRHCEGWQPGIITRVLFSWPMEPNDGVLEQVKNLNKNRLSKQPLDWPSCGSVFKNPLPETAGSLIEKAGLKGYKIGGASVSTKHANFIINEKEATSDDVARLMSLCQDQVQKQFNIFLKSEVVYF